MATVYIGIGSNMGDKIGGCQSAADLVGRAAGCRVKRLSPLYRTEPVGVEDQDWYVNAAAELEVDFAAVRLLDHLLAIERGMGRRRDRRWAPRPLDLDILLFGADVIREGGLIVPHPFLHLRRFVLVPMNDLAPDLLHPVLGKTMAALLDAVPEDGQRVMPVKET